MGFWAVHFFFLESVLSKEVSFKLCLDGRDGKETFDRGWYVDIWMSSHDSRTEEVVEVKMRLSRAEMGSLKLKAPS